MQSPPLWRLISGEPSCGAPQASTRSHRGPERSKLASSASDSAHILPPERREAEEGREREALMCSKYISLSSLWLYHWMCVFCNAPQHISPGCCLHSWIIKTSMMNHPSVSHKSSGRICANGSVEERSATETIKMLRLVYILMQLWLQIIQCKQLNKMMMKAEHCSIY